MAFTGKDSENRAFASGTLSLIFYAWLLVLGSDPIGHLVE